MKQSKLFSDTIHVMVYIALTNDYNKLKSERIAHSVKTNASNVRKIMSNLKKADLLESKRGTSKPHLKKEPDNISLLDIFKSIPGEKNILQVDKETNPDCIVGGNIQAVLTSRYSQLQRQIEKELEQITLADIISDILSEARSKGESYLDQIKFGPMG